MSIKNISQNRWLVRVRTRSEGETISLTRKITGTKKDALLIEGSLRKELADGNKKRSLKLKIHTFGDALRYYRENCTADVSRVKCLFDKLESDLGAVPLYKLTERFSSYWTLIKDERAKRTGNLLAPSTRNRLLMYGKVALNFCEKRGLVANNPLKCFELLSENERDRVLTQEEQDSILAVMERRKSYLTMPFYFSLRNPIRRGDLGALTRKNLDRFKPWIHFYPQKTRKKVNRETCLPFLDDTLLNWFNSLPLECELLFPRIDNKGQWHPLGDWKRHWHSILSEAGVEDFHWHDLKHCAITWMLDNGYSDRDLKNLGIQYTPAMIDRYYKHDANKVLAKWKKSNDRPETVASPCGFSARKSA